MQGPKENLKTQAQGYDHMLFNEILSSASESVGVRSLSSEPDSAASFICHAAVAGWSPYLIAVCELNMILLLDCC